MDKFGKVHQTGLARETCLNLSKRQSHTESNPRRNAVGAVRVTIGVGDPQGQQFLNLEVTVGTGSTFTTVPREILERLGVPIARTVQSELPDGSNAPVDIGRTVIRLEGEEFPTPVIFAEEGEPSLRGVVTLEEALLAVDPVARHLIPTNVLRY